MTIADGKLGHRELAKLSQPGEIIWDGELKGFGARKSENFISFVLMFRNKEGRQRFYTIGKYGSPWTPNIAREKAKELLYQVSQGRDPQTEKINARSADTVEDLCNQYLEEAETGRLRIRGGREKKASTIESDKSRIRCAKGRGRGIAGGRGLAAECGLKGGEMKPSDDLIGNLLEGLVPQTAALTDRMVQPTVQLDHISGSEFAAMLCVSHEYARRLIVASGRGTNNQSNYWVIGRTWAERFALLRRCCRDHNRKLANVDWFESAQRVEIVVLSEGRSEEDSVLESELGIIVEVFGPLPLALGPDEASVFRAIEIFNNKWSGLTRRNSWTDKWADRIERLGIISVEQVKSTGGRGG